MIPYSFKIDGKESEITMVPVPGGTINRIVKNKEGKTRKIAIQVEPFWIAKTETTWGQFRPFMELVYVFLEFEESKIRLVTEDNKPDAVSAPSGVFEPEWRFETCGADTDHPAASMTQFSAKQYTKYISKLSGELYRLPSAAEWEYACRASSMPSSADINLDPKRIWHDANSADQRIKVGETFPNAWGIYGMQGNVAEWVLDQQYFDFKKINSNSISSLDAVAWPAERFGRLAMGGSFIDDLKQCAPSSFKISDKEWWEDGGMIPESPNWLASEEMHAIGFRVIRPIHSNVSNDLKARYWEVDTEELKKALIDRVVFNGCGAIGIVDKDLPKAIEKLKLDEKMDHSSF